MKYILGCDEVGYGAGAGILCVCGVKALSNWSMDGLKDSKKLTPNQRTSLRESLSKLTDFEFHIAERTNNQIDEFGLGVMLKDAYNEIFDKLYDVETQIIVDGNTKFTKYPVTSEPKADNKYTHVMAASIIAKTYRDNLMIKLHDSYPEYGWNGNMGYLADTHIAAIKKFGFSDLHRKSYKIKGINK